MERLQKLVYPDKPIDDVIDEDFLFKVQKKFVCSQCDYENVVNEKETHLILQLVNSRYFMVNLLKLVIFLQNQPFALFSGCAVSGCVV